MASKKPPVDSLTQFFEAKREGRPRPLIGETELAIP